MARPLKSLCLILATVLTAAVASAPAASAAPAHFFANAEQPFVTVPIWEEPFAPKQTFETKWGTFECDFFNGTATASATSNALTVKDVEYWTEIFVEEGPCIIGVTEAEVRFNECHYVFHAGTWNGGGMATGSLDLVCPGEQVVEIDAGEGLCQVFLPPQVGLTRLTYTNIEENPPKGEIVVDVEISNFEYFGEGEFCEGNGNKGVYEGALRMEAYDDVKDGGRVAFGVVEQ
jgi:hypothetical protein